MPEIPAAVSTETVDVVGTVTSIAPLMVVVDGCTVACPAFMLNDAVYAVGDRVRVTVRNPQAPLVLGVESDGSEGA